MHVTKALTRKGLGFDGSSIVLNAEGHIIAQGRSFEEDLIFFDSEILTGDLHEQIESEEASVYAALVHSADKAVFSAHPR
jgi:predicted amidohydrolase